VLPLTLSDPRFYHLDTAFCPLTTGGVLYFPGAFDAPSNRLIEASFAPAQRIVVGEADAKSFVCNAIDLGHTLVMPTPSPAVVARIRQCGLDIREVNVSEFMKAGGGAKCLALELNPRGKRNGHEHAVRMTVPPRKVENATKGSPLS
jgi:N-dimethylarginine dimethylaminohydrolase